MSLAVERSDARPWNDERLEPLFGGAFPEFITADQVVKEYIGRVRAWFPELNIMLIDAGDVPVATGRGVPIRWSGEISDLPDGEYVIPAGLSTLQIDREADCGTYTEPNVWMQHR